MTLKPRIALLGTGIMGCPMARNLAAAGFDTAAWNRSDTRHQALAEAGIHVMPTPADAVRDRDVVIVMLSSGPVCKEILFGDFHKPAQGCQGAVHAMKPGALLIVMSSIGRNEAIDLAAHSQTLGLEWLDAPVSGGEKGAIEGTLSIMAGGTTEAFERAIPILAAMGRPVHIGPAGTGALAKLVNQLTVATTIAAVSEAMTLAEVGGADPARVREAMLGGFAASCILEQHGQRMLDRNFTPGGPSRHQLKDTRAACDVANELGLELPLLKLTDQLFSDLVDAGGGDLDHSALLLEVRRRNRLDQEVLKKPDS
ncbi:NAD(P)-dependent oxidoreductase [Halomonas cupida]|uniref:NAD(P)-dependent oxidoreductase n=1 Tax=Halomonas cupida TaxID=44933 RepID=UPI0039B6ACE3